MDEKLEILLIEDDPEACRDFTEQILDTEDMLLIGVTNNAYKAVDLIKDHLPDAVILDLELHLGAGNGLYVLQELQTLTLPKTPYILITTNNSSTQLTNWLANWVLTLSCQNIRKVIRIRVSLTSYALPVLLFSMRTEGLLSLSRLPKRRRNSTTVVCAVASVRNLTTSALTRSPSDTTI